MRSRLPQISSGWIWSIVLVSAMVVAWALQDRWLPQVRTWIAGDAPPAGRPSGDSHHDHDHNDHDHAHGDGHAHDESTALELSAQARRNIGLRTGEVALQNYQRSITIPAIVAPRPGRTKFEIAAPLTGVVTGVHVVTGEAVKSGTLLFRLRLTHEDLVQTQTEFVNTLGQLDVERREIDRLERVTSSGAVAGKVVLERKYARDKLEATASAQREALLLHGLSEEQVQQIADSRKLIREITITAPHFHDDASLHDEAESREFHSTAADSDRADADDSHVLDVRQFVVTELKVLIGQSVQAGESLCTLSDFSEMYLEGLAFEQDAEALVRAAGAHQTVSAVLPNGRSADDQIDNLQLAYVANQVDPDSRTLRFYVRLPNSIVQDEVRNQRRFLTWRFKPGQRMTVQVPVETWKDVIVLPVEAVAQEGPDTFVFVENGDHFDRRPVHTTYRGQRHVAIANDGSIYPGETVALNSAHQLQMALKNKAGGGVDPHAGHNH